jgi:5'-nucleotidase
MKTDNPIALFDLDGTLANFDKSMSRELEKLRGPNEDPRLDDTMYEDVPHIKARRLLIKSQPGFWRKLEPTAYCGLFHMVKNHGYECYVLTKGPRKVPGAWSEKVEWVGEHFPGTRIIISEEKGLVYGRVLVDDWPPYVLSWLEWRPRGLVVMPAQPWNDPTRVADGAWMANHPQIVRYRGYEDNALLSARLDQANVRKELA